MKTLPLFYYPSTVAWVDDEKTFLDMMMLAFKPLYNIKTFDSSPAFLNYITQYQPPLSKYNFITSNQNDENYGMLKNLPIDFDVTTIATISENIERFKEISVLIVDNHMPEISGLSLAREMAHLPIQKILLTGNTTDDQALEGFNDNIIQRFVQKAEITMHEKLNKYLRILSTQYFCQLTFPLLSFLETEGKMPQSDLLFIDFFEAYCKQYSIVEYYIIDKQGSYLCIDKAAQKSCLVIHTSHSIENWLAIYGAEQCLAEETRRKIANKKLLPFFGVGQEAFHVASDDWCNCFYEPNVLEGHRTYYWSKILL